jgi:hypothetical protein
LKEIPSLDLENTPSYHTNLSWGKHCCRNSLLDFPLVRMSSVAFAHTSLVISLINVTRLCY